jgi:Transposase IS66 family
MASPASDPAVVHADETSWRHAGANYWVWYAGDDHLAYLQLDPHRSAQAALGPEQKHCFTCFRRPGVPPTNNQAERSLRPVVIMRKVVHGTGSVQDLENHSVLRSLFETARRQGKQPHRFFLDLFTKNTVQAQAALYRHRLDTKPRPHLRC